MYNVKESVIRKAFEDAVKAGEVVFTGGFLRLSMVGGLIIADIILVTSARK